MFKELTGSLAAHENTSHSGLSCIKTFLLGQPQFQGDEKFLIFGNVLHQHLQFIEDVKFRSPMFPLLTTVDQQHVLNMLEAARKNPVVKKLIAKSKREIKEYGVVDGVRFAYILDVYQPHTKTGVDWKSTSCSSLQAFKDSVVDYDYTRQGKSYKIVLKLKYFYFVGLQKKPPYNVYIVDVDDMREHVRYAENELEFLLYFCKRYGKYKKINR